MEVSCIVLAGGRSTRLGRNKITEIIGEQSLLERVISILSQLNTEIIIVTAKDSSLPQLTPFPKLKFTEDVFPGKGSLGGIYSGLIASRSVKNLIVACDMPFLNLDLLRYMVEASGEYDIVVPKLKDNIFEPLHAVYSKNCINPLKQLIQANVFRIIELFTLVKTKYLSPDEIDKIDPGNLSFFNINTETDLQTGREIVRKEGIQGD